MRLSTFERLPPAARARIDDGLSVAIDAVATRAPSTHGFLRYGWYAAALDERAYVDLITNRFTKEQELATLRLALLDRQVAVSTLLGLGLPGVETLGLVDPGTRGAAR